MNNRQKLVQKQFLNNEEAVIQRLNQVYRKSLSDVEDKIKNLQFSIGKLQQEYNWMDPDDPEKEKVKSQIQSKIYQKQYQEQLQKQLDGILKQMQKDQYLTVSEYLDGCYTDGFVGSIFDLSGQGVPLMMPIDQQSMVHAVQLDSKISKGLYTRLGEDVDLLKKKITAQVSRSIATGESFAQTARQLAGVSSIGYNNAIRIARTEGHRIQTTATMDVMHGAKDRGADVVKQWDAALDARTRDSHVKVDGEWRDIDKKFSNGLRYPGDPHGAAAEVINCRCALLQRAKWALADGFTKMDGFTDEIKSFDSTETYNEFKKAYFSKENRAYMNYVTELEERYGKDFNTILSRMTDDEYNYFVKLEKARPQFSGMYRGDSTIIKGAFTKNNYSVKDLQTKPQRPKRGDFANDELYRIARGEYRSQRAKYDEQFDKIIRDATTHPPAFTTKEQLVEWVNDLGIGIDPKVLETVDLRSFNEVKTALEEMFERFPQIRSYEREYYDGSIVKTAFNIGLDDSGLLSANGGFNFNAKYFADYEVGLREALEGMADGFTVMGDGSFSTLVRHEFGHNVQSYIEATIADKHHMNVDDWHMRFQSKSEWEAAQKAYSEEYQKYKDDLFSIVGLDGSSEYSTTNEAELFAEGFAEWSSGGTSDFAKQFGTFFERWFK